MSNRMTQVMNEVVKGKLYGRQWRVLIQTKEKVALEVTDLRCTFDISMSATGQPKVCHLTIYNLAAGTEGDIITEGFYVIIEAGYGPQYGVVFEGNIIQVFRNREDGINYRLEILAADGSAFLHLNYINTTLAAGSDPRQIVMDVSRLAKKPIETQEVSENLDKNKLARPKVLFGLPKDYLDDIAKGNSSFYWVESGKLIMRRYSDAIPENECVVLTPESGLVGTPEYTDQGIRIVSLLNPRIVIKGMVKIDNEIIRRSAVNIPTSGQGNSQSMSQVAMFDQDGEYQVFSVHHVGDTHGETWITEIVGVGRNGIAGLPLMVENEKQDVRG